MDSSNYDYQQLDSENFRIDTYDSSYPDDIKNKLAKAGFYWTAEKKVKCFQCSYELDTSNFCPNEDVIKLHKEKSPSCMFIRDLGCNIRSKKFLSYDSLRYERERLQTFIDWNIQWLSPADLAADGFYYLRTHDHCACVFCRGIVGAWDVGDTPRGEHQRHFPHCPFIRGQAVGNVPTSLSEILDRLPLDGEECPIPPPRCDYTTDHMGTGAERLLPGSFPDATRKNEVNFEDIGLPKYTGPKRKDYVTKESRVKTYSKWPERLEQTPEEMAEAGFFYCGLSDHVRCFHCGNGLRNWETNDKPWDEHARWYPNCNFVLLSKGQEFVDKVQRENPPYMRSITGQPQKVAASSGRFKPVSESDLETLMKLDIMQAVSVMCFPATTIRRVLRQKIERTGLPFFSLESCIEAILQLMNKETRPSPPESPYRRAEDAPGSPHPQTSGTGSSSPSPNASGPPPQTITPAESPETSSSELAEPPESMEMQTEATPRSTIMVIDIDTVTAELERMRENRMCKICMYAEMNVVFLPCHHMVTCSDCAVTMANCPICRVDIKYAIKPIIS